MATKQTSKKRVIAPKIARTKMYETKVSLRRMSLAIDTESKPAIAKRAAPKRGGHSR